MVSRHYPNVEHATSRKSSPSKFLDWHSGGCGALPPGSSLLLDVCQWPLWLLRHGVEKLVRGQFMSVIHVLVAIVYVLVVMWCLH